MTNRQLLIKGTEMLRMADIADAGYDAGELFGYVMGISRTEFFLRSEENADEEATNRYLELISRRASHIPLQYITGTQCFMGYDYKVDGRVLIPRQDTEVLVEQVAALMKKGDRILDVCTGSGCILLSLLRMVPETTGVGVDISREALSVAEDNGRDVSQAQFVYSDLFDNVEGLFDVIVSNPPYIETAVIEGLDAEVKDYEPRLALDGGTEGLDFYRRIVRDAGTYLKDNGILAFEIGYNQGHSVSDILEANGYQDIQVIKDYAGLDRVVIARYVA